MFLKADRPAWLLHVHNSIISFIIITLGLHAVREPMLPPKAPSMLLHCHQILFPLYVGLNTRKDKELKRRCLTDWGLEVTVLLVVVKTISAPKRL